MSHGDIPQSTSSSKPAGFKIARLLCYQNPFYLISAAIVLYGFSAAVTPAEIGNQTWALAGLFAGYTTLLALSAWAIVKFGKVWDDARSILMVLLLLFLALSSSVDFLCIKDPQTALALALAGFGFSVLLTECLVRSLGIRFKLLFRGSLYLLLGISFLFPLSFSIHQLYFPHLDSRLLVLAFPIVCAVGFLSLVPAIRMGRRYAAKNGTPWNWPLYPWSVFVLLLVGLCFRIAMITWAFDSSAGVGMLGPWLYIPVLFAVSWLLIEFGIVEANGALRKFGLALLPVAIYMAVDRSTPKTSQLYHEIANNFASPVWMTFVGIVAVYAISLLRGVREAKKFLGVSLVAIAFMGTDGRWIDSVAGLQGWPFVGLATLLIATWNGAGSRRWLAVSACLSVPIAQTAAFVGTIWNEELSPPVVWCCLVLLSAFLICMIHNDRFAKQIRVVLSFAFPVVAIGIVVGSIHETRYIRADAMTILFGIASVTAYGLRGSRLHLSSAACSTGAIATRAVTGADSLATLQLWLGVESLQLIQFLAAGLGCLLLGLLVSAAKAGALGKILRGFGKLKMEFVDAFGFPSESKFAGAVEHRPERL